MQQNRPKLILTCLETLCVLAFALRVLSWFASPTPHIDEFYHVLAAQAWNADGTLVINEGGQPYTRARGFTYAVGLCARLFGEDWRVMRLPSLVSGGLLISAVFFWLHRYAGRRSAWLGAALLAFAPGMIGYSSMVRFYVPNALFTWLTAMCAYALVVGGLTRWGSLAVGVLGLGCVSIAVHLQETTLFALVFMALWALGYGVVWLRRAESKRRRRVLLALVLLLVLAGGVAAVVLYVTGAGAYLLRKATVPRLWAEMHRENWLYYHRYFGNTYPLLWAGLPFAAVVALVHRRKPAWFCLFVFACALVLHSCLGLKSVRYMLYTWPFFFGLWAIALDGLIVWLLAQTRTLIGGLFSEDLARRGWVTAGAGCFLIASLLFAGLVSPGYKLGRQMIMGESLGDQARSNWAEAARILEPIARQTGFVVSSSPPKAVYYLGRHDVGLSVSQSAGREEFALERIMGRPVITSPQSVAAVIRDHPAGLIVIEQDHFGARWFVPTETALFIESLTRPIEIPGDTGVKAFRWGPK